MNFDTIWNGVLQIFNWTSGKVIFTIDTPAGSFTLTLASFLVAMFITPIVLGALIPWFNDNDGEDDL